MTDLCDNVCDELEPAVKPAMETLRGLRYYTQPRFYKTNRQVCRNIHDMTGIERVCPEIPPDTKTRFIPNDTINTELIYYTTVLRESVPVMSVFSHKKKIIPWVRKLYAPEYQTSQLRFKRNLYLMHLTLVVLTDSIFGIFKNPPPVGALPQLEELCNQEPIPPARWEIDTCWDELINSFKEDEGYMKCHYHEKCCANEHNGCMQPVPGALLDQEFKFFLYLSRPYLMLLCQKARRNASLWMMTLATIRTCACLLMKGLRNDYMQLLLGYLHDLRLAGPFIHYPPSGALPPLEEMAKLHAVRRSKPLTDPTCTEAEEFMSTQVVPESGVFCFIALTGDAADPQKVSTVPLVGKTNDFYLK